MTRPVRIEDRLIGSGEPCLVIAEAGVNHNGDVALAHRLVDEAAEAGVDAVKFQRFVTEELITREAPKAGYQILTTGDGGGQHAMLKALELADEHHLALKRHCEERGLLYLCTPYEAQSIDFLDRIGVAAYKVASTDTTNLPFLRHLASKGRPVLLSTGMSTLGEVDEAVTGLVAGGLGDGVVVLHCTSEYPAPPEEANLRAMRTLELATGCPVGFSDHTPGIGMSPFAVALGAVVVEKHFTLDRGLPGPDHAASLEPAELRRLVEAVRMVEQALGDGVKRPTPSELANKPLMQKSLVSRRHLRPGEIIRAEDLACKRPATGLPASWFDRVVGRRTAVAVARDETLTLASVRWDAPPAGDAARAAERDPGQ